MPQNSKSVSQTADSEHVCTIPGCAGVFNTLQGLRIHQRTCVTKQKEREQNAAYEAQLETEHTAKAEGVIIFINFLLSC
jgi:hypothetical protein